MATKTETATTVKRIDVPPLSEGRIIVELESTAPYAQKRFSEKAKADILGRQKEGGTARSKKARVAKDVEADFHASYYRSPEGWYGINISAFQKAMIEACRTCDVVMTQTKVGFNIVPDGWDADGETALVRITEGEPEKQEVHVRLQPSGVADVHIRALYKHWKAQVTIDFNPERFRDTDMVNLLMRAGRWCGIGEGRPSAKNGGMGYGLFKLVAETDDMR